MVSVIKRSSMWVFLTANWGILPGALLYYVLGLAHQARGTRVALALAAVVILGGVSALGALRVMTGPRQNPRSTATATVSAAISAAIMIDVLILCVAGVSLYYNLYLSDLH